MKKILIIADPIQNININGDSTYLMFLTAHDLGYQVFYTTPNKLFALNNQAFAHVIELSIKHGVDEIHSTPNWFEIKQEINDFDLTNFDGIYIRNDPPFNMEYYYLTQILDLCANSGVKIFNNPTILRNCNEKLTILNFPEHITPTLVSKDKQTILNFINTHDICVAKPIDLMAGRGIFRVTKDEANKNAILESLTDYYTQTIMVQKFIPEVIHGDKRIFIINGEVISHCLYRIPQNGEIRGNLAVGGRGEVHPLNEHDYVIATTGAKWLVQQNIMIAGIDVIGKCLTEVNVTSPTAMQQIYRDTKINIAEKILTLI